MNLNEAKVWMVENQRILTVEGPEINFLFFRMVNGVLQFRKTGEEWAQMSRGYKWLGVDRWQKELNLENLVFKVPDESCEGDDD